MWIHCRSQQNIFLGNSNTGRMFHQNVKSLGHEYYPCDLKKMNKALRISRGRTKPFVKPGVGASLLYQNGLVHG